MEHSTHSDASYLTKLQDYIQNSEYDLIQFMHSEGVWIGDFPDPPTGYEPGKGNIELGLAGYWLNHPLALNFPPLLTAEVFAATEIWSRVVGSFPKTLMTDANYKFINSPENHMIYHDGSVLSGEKYATYDPYWFLAFLNLVITFVRRLWKFEGSSYPADSTPIPIASKTGSDTVKIAIVGDWGTGNEIAATVMQHITAQNPDYIVHLGDVYYSGTPDERKHYFHIGEERHHLLALWPQEYAGRSFTLNSNHEMYTGANGYFDVALGDPSTPFTAQKNQGCFALTFGDWTLLGLDSGYFGTSFDAFMQGSIGDEGTPQREWIKGLNLDGEKTVVFTHHTGFAEDCTSVNELWTQVYQSLGKKDPFAWYWGHVHNGIVYESPLTIPQEGSPDFKTNTFARCSGHGAIPYGNTPSLDIPQVVWRETQEVPSTHQLHHGFSMIELTKSGDTVVKVDESYFNTSQLEAVYHSNLFSSTTQEEEAPVKVKKPAKKKAPAKKTPKKVATKKVAIKKPAANSNFAKALKAKGVEFNQDLYAAIKKYLGPAASDADASLVACSDPSEVKTIKNNFLIQKLGQKSSSKLNRVIREVCEALGTSNKRKDRVEFYYLLTIIFQKEDVFV
jgi:3',5'-cyclic AMP phosphodiesterase CpdA